jgi:phenylalanyl-tRNA synthetase alpha chain
VNGLNSIEEIIKIKDSFFGKTGKISEVMKDIRHATVEEKPLIGQKVNEIKQKYLGSFDEKIKKIQQDEQNKKLLNEAVDITLPSNRSSAGKAHPIHLAEEELVRICESMGFSVASGPIIEDEFHNFEALNIPDTHPSRDMHDTFYLTDNQLLRTHTSSVQIRYMKQHQPPIKIIAPGQVFRSDADRTHSPMFHQLEGLYVDKDVSVTDLKFALETLLHTFFTSEFDIRFRSSYFPFTEPSFEVDVAFNQSGEPEWMEVLGAGMVHHNVLKAVDVDPEVYSGYAFGLGIDRLAMLKYNIRDIRSFYDNDSRFLRQEQ